MNNDETKPPSLREEMIDKYFSMKLIQAERDEDDVYLKFLHESLRLWQEQRSLGPQVAQDIARWQEETDRLDKLIPLRGPSRVSVQVTPRPWLFNVPSPIAEVLVLTAVVNALVLIAMTALTLWGGWDTAWTLVFCSVLSWTYLLQQLHLRRKGSS